MAKQGVLVFGELLVDIFIDPSGNEYDRRPGGAPANLACHLRDHLASRDPIHLVSALGPVGEQDGDALWQLLAERGIDLTLVQRHPSTPTGLVHVHHHDQNSPYTILPDAAYDKISPTESLLAVARECSVICFGSLIRRTGQSADTLEQVLKASDALHVCDINFRRDCFTRETIVATLKHTHILKLNESEVRALGALLGWGEPNPAELFERLHRVYGIGTMVVTLGERGVTAFSAGGVGLHEAGFPSQNLDPTGAGDAFTAMFLAKLISDPRFNEVMVLGPSLHAVSEEHLRECCMWANALGALVASRRGGMTRVETHEVAELVAERVAQRRLDPGFPAPDSRERGLPA
ncbi:MAG: PfkB family carbohydrate kinase [Bdellovibrionota bacterium]|nr:MAG: PfkB family carbohydrate kinase [Bdellovibrionota bacterium]